MKLRFSQYVSVGLISLGLLVQPGWDRIQQLDADVPATARPNNTRQPTMRDTDVPVYVGSQPIESAFPATTATSIYIMDSGSGAILFQSNADQPRYPASTEKMMTALVARRLYPLDDVLTVKEEAFSLGSTAGLHLGEQLTVEQLLHALLIPSGNDAAFVLANHHVFGYQGFVNAMNDLAKEYHLDHTTFSNPSGLDVVSQTSTARDLGIIGNQFMKDPVLRGIVSQKSYDMHDVTGTFHHQLNTTDELLGVVDGVVGIKTGTTDLAGENLITEVDRDGHQVIFVLLGSKDRFNETQHMIDWIFSQYQWQKMVH